MMEQFSDRKIQSSEEELYFQIEIDPKKENPDFNIEEACYQADNYLIHFSQGSVLRSVSQSYK